MATLRAVTLPQPTAASWARLRSWLDGALGIYAQPVFSRRRAVGLLVLLALCAAPASLAFSAFALLGATAAMHAFKLVRDYTPYNYNALLCGSALGGLYALTPQSAGFALALGAFSVVITAALAAVAGSFGYLPVAALPYTLCMWAVLGLAPYLSLPLAAYSGDALAQHLPHLAAVWLQSLGSLVLVPKALAGCALVVALLVHSRIASIVAAAALSSGLLLLQLAPSEPVDALVHAVCANSVLTALSLAGVWLVPSRATTLVALGSGLMAAFFTLGSVTALYWLGLWPGFLPASIALVVALTALRQRSDQRVPQLAQSVAENPEQLLLDHLARPHAPGLALVITPPFHGAWMCTQGPNGPFTHRGALAHAYDFEIADAATGSFCRDAGEQPQDYYCFAQPVLAIADGTVIAIETTKANNAIGDIDGQQPWGNYVIVQHQPEVFSLVAHLSPGTVTVYPGQYVQRGAVLAYCGSSGRSPRPHLHFQLQSGPALGSATIPCELLDMVVRTGDRLRYAPTHEAAQGETLRLLNPDYALAAMFDVPLGSTLSYRQGDKIERIVCDLDSWGRIQLRSLDFDAQLIISRSYTCLRSCELRGSSRSVLRLLRLALGVVPFERDVNLRFGGSVPRRWVAGFGRELLWDMAAALHAPAALTLESRIELDAKGLVIVSESTQRSATGEPVLETRARFAIGASPLLPAAVGPSSIEVITRLHGARSLRTERAELVVEAPIPRKLITQSHGVPRSDQAQELALGLGEWS